MAHRAIKETQSRKQRWQLAKTVLVAWTVKHLSHLQQKFWRLSLEREQTHVFCLHVDKQTCCHTQVRNSKGVARLHNFYHVYSCETKGRVWVCLCYISLTWYLAWQPFLVEAEVFLLHVSLCYIWLSTLFRFLVLRLHRGHLSLYVTERKTLDLCGAEVWVY